MITKAQLLIFCCAVSTVTAVFLGGVWWGKQDSSIQISSFFVPGALQELAPSPLPYLKYAIPALRQYPLSASQIVLEEETKKTATSTQYIFSYTTLNKRMTGQLHLPTTTAPETGYPVILMARGWAPAETYRSGIGTEPAAQYFAEHGYATIAPDFFGFGESDPEPSDSWEARFIKPINILELLTSIKEYSTIMPLSATDSANIPAATLQLDTTKLQLNPTKIGFWGHSNGGQILLSVLEALDTPVPTSLWAPVTAPFPYSLLYFSDESDDEGKELRKWLSLFEKEYDVFEFSVTQHLDLLHSPLQIQHGTADTSALVDWSDALNEKLATRAGELSFSYYRYPGVDHNMRPRWSDAVAQDLKFFTTELE
jgi:hypothetical protein